MSFLSVPSPVGVLTLFARGDALVAIEWGRAPEDGGAATPPVLREAATQLSQYFDREREDFDLPLMPAGTDCLPFDHPACNLGYQQMQSVCTEQGVCASGCFVNNDCPQGATCNGGGSLGSCQ